MERAKSRFPWGRPSPRRFAEHTRTELGTLGGRVTWKARVLDFKAPSRRIQASERTLLNSLASSTKGTRPIPGVEFYNDRTVTVRTK